MLRKKQGFTLIELMVVIVIIGVLASLAIPRLTEASDKAKVAEAPGVISTYERAYLAALAERGEVTDLEDLIFDLEAVNDGSRWFGYGDDGTGATSVVADPEVFKGTPKTRIGKFGQTVLVTTYSDADMNFVHSAETEATTGIAKKFLPNFMP